MIADVLERYINWTNADHDVIKRIVDYVYLCQLLVIHGGDFQYTCSIMYSGWQNGHTQLRVCISFFLQILTNVPVIHAEMVGIARIELTNTRVYVEMAFLVSTVNKVSVEPVLWSHSHITLRPHVKMWLINFNCVCFFAVLCTKRVLSC